MPTPAPIWRFLSNACAFISCNSEKQTLGGQTSEVGFPDWRSVAVPGHSNVIGRAVENLQRLGCSALLRPRTGALRMAITRFTVLSISRVRVELCGLYLSAFRNQNRAMITLDN
jgi:hypothetical protein